MSRMKSGLLAGLALCMAATPAWAADDASNAALRAELEMLKSKMARIESQIGSSSGTGDGVSLPTVHLPSGLSGLQLSGFADVSYIYSFNEAKDSARRTTNRGRSYDTEANGFTPHAIELAIEKPLSEESPVGFRTDLYIGDDAELIHSAGLGIASDSFDLQQAYVALRAPVGDGLDFKVGKFQTPIGAEVYESPYNWNFSRSFLFTFAEPGTHTGVLASYPVVDGLASVSAGVVNGWDVVDDTNKGKSVLGSITLTPAEGVTLIANAITGPEQIDNSRDKRTLLDLVGIWQATEQLAFMANYDFGHESGGRATTFDAKEWAGLALYTKYDISDKWALVGRWEWFDDKDNFRSALTGADGTAPTDIDYYGLTLTSQWKLYDRVIARLEYRHDKADEAVFFRNADSFTNYQDTVAAEVIYLF